MAQQQITWSPQITVITQKEKSLGHGVPKKLKNVDLEQLIKCSHCLQYYSDLRRPRVINCGHTYCSPCLEGVLNGGPPYSSAICKNVLQYYTKATEISCNYSMDSIVPHIKKHLGITCKSQLVGNNEKETEALILSWKEEEFKLSIKEEIEKEFRNNLEEEIKYNLEKDIKYKIDKEVKEQLKMEKANMKRLKVKLENEYKKNKEESKKSLQNTQAKIREEIKNLKKLRNQDRCEVRRLMNENKKLSSEIKSIKQRKKKVSLQE